MMMVDAVACCGHSMLSRTTGLRQSCSESRMSEWSMQAARRRRASTLCLERELLIPPHLSFNGRCFLLWIIATLSVSSIESRSSDLPAAPDSTAGLTALQRKRIGHHWHQRQCCGLCDVNR